MLIAFDLSMLAYAGSGVATYTFNVAKNLLLYDKKNEYRFFYASLRRPKNFYYLDELKKLGGKIYQYPFPHQLLNFLWNKNHLLPVEHLIGKVDFYHSSDFYRPPLFYGTKGITTIHDLTWKVYPQYHPPAIIEAHERKMEKTIKYRDIIIVPSQSTKNDLLKFYPQAKKNNKIYVIYEGIDDRFRPINDKKKIEKVLQKYLTFNFSLLTFNFLLYVGAIEPRKNLEAAIKVFSRLLKDKNYSDFRFLLVGKKGWRSEEIFKLIKDLNLNDKVIYIGFVPDEDLPYFYNGAKALIYLSRYEGFGLPPLEALSCGTPVLAAANSSLQEILPKDYLVDLKNEEKILQKLIFLLNSDKSVKINKQFSWKEFVESFLKIMNDIPAESSEK
jgi:glycosyltransferase involved in cell wall biosynthesis